MFQGIKKGVLIGAALAAVSAFSTASMAQEYKIGIQAYKGIDVGMREWKPTADYLTAKLGKPFTVLALTDKDLTAGVKDGKGGQEPAHGPGGFEHPRPQRQPHHQAL